MYDSGGNGWQDNIISINDVNYTLDDGSSGLACVPKDSNDCYIMYWHQGNQGNSISEVSFSFLDHSVNQTEAGYDDNGPGPYYQGSGCTFSCNHIHNPGYDENALVFDSDFCENDCADNETLNVCGTCGDSLNDCCTCREFWNTRTAIPWSLEDGRTGETYQLRQFQKQGKPVVLEFIAHWCPFSWDYSENGLLSAFSKRYGPNGTHGYHAFVISVDASTNDFSELEAPNQHGTNQNWLDIISYPLAANTFIGNVYPHQWFPHVAVICPDNSYRFWRDFNSGTRPYTIKDLLDETMSCMCRKPFCDVTYCDNYGGDADGDSICDHWDPDVPTPPDTDAGASSSSGSGSSSSTTMIAVVCVVVGVIAAVGAFILIQRNKGKHSYQQKFVHEDDVHLEVGEGR